MISEKYYRDLKLNIEKKRVKRLSIKIKNNEVFVIVPLSTSEKSIEELVDQYYEWIERKLQNKKISVNYGDPIYIMGKPFDLCEQRSGRSKVVVQDMDVIVYGPSSESRKKAFDKYCEKLLLETFSGFNQFDVEIRFRNYKSKWGCCYPDKRIIYYNYRLASLPLDAIEYVYYHEMAHLKVKNHQKVFYEEVARLLPNYKVGKKQIKDYAI